MDLPLGAEVTWSPARLPEAVSLRGRHVLLRPVEPAVDAQPLYEASHPPAGDPAIWTYLAHGPYADAADLRVMLAASEESMDPLFFTVVTLPDRRASGMVSYLRITPQFGVIEIGNIWFGPSLARTTGATEAIFLLAEHAFDGLGYRRLEWKCNALNAASRRAAERFGFTFEGISRNHQIVKGRNRDTAWYAMTTEEWPTRRRAFAAWLASENFDADGKQRRSLRALRARDQRAVLQGQ